MMNGDGDSAQSAETAALGGTPSAPSDRGSTQGNGDRDQEGRSPLQGPRFSTDLRNISNSLSLDPNTTAAWREKAGAFFSSSSLRIKNAASIAGVTVAEAAGGASVKMKDTWQVMQPRVAEAASKASTSVKETWETTRENWNTKVAPRMEAGISVAVKSATDTGLKLKQGLLETTEKVRTSAVGQKLGEMTQAGVHRSQELLAKNDWRSKTMRAQAATNATAVFGVPLAVAATRGIITNVPVPSIVLQCCDFLIKSGLQTPYLFEEEGDPSEVKRIMKGFDEDPEMTIPEETAPLDVAQLLLVYFKCLPEPVLTYRLYPDFASFGGSDVQHLCRLLRTLPSPNLETLNRVLGLLHNVSLNCDENKMDAQSLAAEFAPVLAWREGIPSSHSRDSNSSQTSSLPKTSSSDGIAEPTGSSLLDPVSEHEAKTGETGQPTEPKVIVDVDGNIASAAEIPLDNDEPTHEQTALVEAVMVLIEQHDKIFSHSPDGPVMLISEMSL